MPANAAGRGAVLNLANADGNIVLIEVTHDDITTQRLAMARSDVVSTLGGGSPVTFTAYPFEISLPTDDKGVPRGTIRISREPAAVAEMVVPVGEIWDGRWRVRGPDQPPGASIATLGEAGLAQ